jgi:hypothetical protein
MCLGTDFAASSDPGAAEAVNVDAKVKVTTKAEAARSQ